MADKIVLGSGNVYIADFVDTVPADAVIEVDGNLLGRIQGGASISYKPTFYSCKDDMGIVSKKFITDEEVMFKSGVMTWNGKTLQKLASTAKITEAAKLRTVKIGGAANYDGKSYVIHFVHKDAVDGDIRVTIVGSNEAGFELAFAKDKETVINAEFKAIAMDSAGTLITYKETLPVV